MSIRLTDAVPQYIFEIVRIFGKLGNLHEGMLLEIMENYSGYVVVRDIASRKMLLLPDSEIGQVYGELYKLCDFCEGTGSSGGICDCIECEGNCDCIECEGNGFLWSEI
jgi:hypothetical protein